jgi:AmmeMemoRadiSam system protein A
MSLLPPVLDDSAKNELLALARRTLEVYLACGEIPRYFTSRLELCVRCGAFVSLHRGKDLRGCIGLLAPDEELYRTVQRCAISSAVEDSRFPPVTYEELPELTIELSILAPLQAIRDPVEVEVGRHGLLISREGRRGLLLPQVATENQWDRETFLSQTCRKAGLPPDAWRDPDISIERFTAQVFSE